jgi:hypothetical protein
MLFGEYFLPTYTDSKIYNLEYDNIKLKKQAEFWKKIGVFTSLGLIISIRIIIH